MSDSHFTIVRSAGANGVVYGVFQPRTPHSLAFSHNERLGDKGLVAAVFATVGSNASFGFTTGVRGVHWFVRQGDEFVPADHAPALPASIEGGSHELFAEEAPLAFLREHHASH